MCDYLVSLYFNIVIDMRCFPRERFFGRHTIFNYKWLTGRFINDLLYDFWASSYSITCIRLYFSRFILELNGQVRVVYYYSDVILYTLDRPFG